jgi:DNA-binding NarL/FixJ family response regulator
VTDQGREKVSGAEAAEAQVQAGAAFGPMGELGATGDETVAGEVVAGEAMAAGAAPIRLVLVDDHRMFRTGVRAELDEVAGAAVEVVGEADDAPRAVAVILATRPQVVLLDVHLPGGGGIEVLKQCLARAPEVRFLALSVSDAAEDVIGVIRAGARGYVTKSITGTELVDAVRRVADGDAVFSPRLAGFVLDAFSGSAAPVDEELDRLTAREREVLRLIARGYAYKEIARELVISVKTVESHVSSVLRKLQLSNRHELSRWATARRLV